MKSNVKMSIENNIIRETDKAVLVKATTERYNMNAESYHVDIEVWLPKSQIEISEKAIILPAWLVAEKKIIAAKVKAATKEKTARQIANAEKRRAANLAFIAEMRKSGRLPVAQ